MSEITDCPPPLPGSEVKSGKLSETLSWCVIVVSVIFLAWTASNPLEDHTAEQTADTEGLVPIAEANELAMLKLQSRMFIGLSQFHPGEALRSVGQLEDMAETPRGKAAVALIYHFIDDKNGKKRGLETLEKIDTSTPKNQQLKQQVQAALENGVDQSQRTALDKQLGWFASLAKSSSGDDDDGYRDQVLAESTKSMVTIFGFSGLVVFAFITGLVLLVLFLNFIANRRMQLHYDASKSPALGHLFLEAFAVYIGIMALGHLLGAMVDERISMVAYAVSFLLALFWPKLRGCSWKQVRELIGWHRGTGIFREIGAGILGYLGIIVFAFVGLLTTLLLIAIVNAIQSGTTPETAAGASHPIVGMLDATESIWGKLYLLFFAAGLAPLLEETMFRGALFRYLRQNMGFTISAVLGGIIFAIIHPQGILALPALSAMGIGFALLREWRDSLIASMTAHALNNGAIVCLLLLVIG